MKGSGPGAGRILIREAQKLTAPSEPDPELSLKIIYTFFLVGGLEVLLQGREPQLFPPLLLDPPDALRHLPLPLGRLLLLLAPRLVRLLVQLLEGGLLLRPLLVVL
jgi:hypothetical protein